MKQRLREEGLVIDALATKYGRSDKSLSDALAYVINCTGDELTSKQLFDSAERLRSFTIYRQNTEFAPLDIEKPEELEKYLEDLTSNGFLRESQRKFSIVETPVEGRIVKLLGSRPLSETALQNHFVTFSPNDAILAQVYLPTLERKGLVTIKDDIALQQLESAVRSANDAYEKLVSRIATSKKSRWWSYSMLCVSKERGDRLISIDDFESYVREIHETLCDRSSSLQAKVQLRRSRLPFALLTHF